MLLDWTEVFKQALESDKNISILLVGLFFLVFAIIQLYFQGKTIEAILGKADLLSKSIVTLVSILGSIYISGYVLNNLIAFAMSMLFLPIALTIAFLFISIQMKELRRDLIEGHIDN